MVQFGNFHIGKPASARMQVLTAGEAYTLWDSLTTRYDIIYITKLYINFVHDTDFKYILEFGLTTVLEEQVAEMEQMMIRYKLPLPQRPPVEAPIASSTDAISDEHIFKRLFTGIQTFIENHIRSIRVQVFNAELRDMSTSFLKKELTVYHKICKYGKLKGWLITPPTYYGR